MENLIKTTLNSGFAKAKVYVNLEKYYNDQESIPLWKHYAEHSSPYYVFFVYFAQQCLTQPSEIPDVRLLGPE